MSTIPITACEWRVGPPGLGAIRIVAHVQRNGRVAYAVERYGVAANRAHKWESLPSANDAERRAHFIARCWFEEWEEAAQIAQDMAQREGAAGRGSSPGLSP